MTSTTENSAFRAGVVAGLPFLLVGLIVAILGFFFRNSIERDNQASYDAALESYSTAYAKAEPKPSPEEMDGWLDEDMERYADSPDMFHGIEPQKLDDRKAIVKGIYEGVEAIVGDDHHIRFAAYELLFTFFHANSLTLVKTRHYMRTGKSDNVLVEEVHADHIDSISFETRNGFPIQLNHNEIEIDGIHRLTIWLTGGRTIQIDTLDGILYLLDNKGVIKPTNEQLALEGSDEGSGGDQNRFTIGEKTFSLENVSIYGDLADSNGIETFYELKEFVDNWRRV